MEGGLRKGRNGVEVDFVFNSFSSFACFLCGLVVLLNALLDFICSSDVNIAWDFLIVYIVGS